ncbi:MAG: peptide chain release factor 2 [Firmicutes bacterium]|nr:peptide chain release factor 2 [Bacillota bacterium]
MKGIKERIEELDLEISTEGFWDELERAQKTLQEKKNLENRIASYEECRSMFEDIELAMSMSEDPEMAAEAEDLAEKLDKKMESIQISLLLNGEYDKSNAVLSIHPGAGGLESQDWADMLLRMYTRYSNDHGFKVTLLDIQPDPEAGIKSAELLIEGENAYGYLKSERGVHRLVRLSPYNANNKRQTSFASVDVTPDIGDNVEVNIAPEDLRIDTYRSSGAGGQHVNKTDSAVRITHIPTGIVVTCQNERSQIQNKAFAMRVLYGKLLALAREQHMEKISDLKGNFSQISFGSQIRNYVFQPYTLVKDTRTGAETGNINAVMDGDLDMFINAYLVDLQKGEK